ncbi:MAG TPA: hypothetical protein ENK02_08605 [Planctomycetes bacterium]|nr:hypothetical protein [Planctomycetota bacterium]
MKRPRTWTLLVGLMGSGLGAASPFSQGAPPALEFVRMQRRQWGSSEIRVLRRRGRIVGVVLQKAPPSLEGIELPFAFPFPTSCERIEVWEPPGGKGLVLFEAGVREDLWVHVIRRWGESFHGYSLKVPGGRLPPLRFAPIMDLAGETLSFLYEDRGGIHFEVHSFTARALPVLFSRTLASLPTRVQLQTVLHDPWIEVRVDGARWKGPGERVFREGSFREDRFLHPLAAFPIPSVPLLDLGGIPEKGEKTAQFFLKNPGRLPLPLQWSFSKKSGWKLRIRPQAGTLKPGEKRAFTLRVQDGGPGGSPTLSLGLIARSPSGGGDPLVEIPLRGRRSAVPDQTPPELRPERIRLRFAPEMRILVEGLPGAVRDSHPPIRLGGPGGKEALASEDGAFRLLVPRTPGGKVLLWTQDALGNRGRPISVGRLEDREPPKWDPSRIRLSLPVNGKVQLLGAPGALRDDTPPLELEVEIDGKTLPKSFPVRRDGSFRLRLAARPGQRILLVARDSSVPSRRSLKLPVGIVLPYLERSSSKEALLHGPPFAPFELIFRAGKTPLSKRRGRLDSKGRASFALHQKLWRVERVRVQDPASERWYELQWK